MSPFTDVFFGKFKGLLPLEYYTKFVLSVDLSQVVLLPRLSYLPLVSIATPLTPSLSHCLHLSNVYIEALEPHSIYRVPFLDIPIGTEAYYK